jgi:hypothetical protein
MYRRVRNCVSAFLPLLPLSLCPGCGSGGSEPGNAPTEPSTGPSSPASVNQAPTIAVTSVESAHVGMTYVYQPQASDPEGDALSFTAANLPPWASIDTNTGRISGTPGENDAGVYESIVITVADAARSTLASPFNITVLGDEAATGIASLKWEVPPSKVDGSPLDDLAGYRILFGRSSDNLDGSVYIGDPSATGFEFSTLSPGLWYFAVVGVNAGGLEGPPTTVATKSI